MSEEQRYETWRKVHGLSIKGTCRKCGAEAMRMAICEHCHDLGCESCKQSGYRTWCQSCGTDDDEEAV